MHRSEYNDVKANLIKKSLDQNDKEVVVPIERRKRKDGRLQFINLMSFLVWGVVIVIISIITKAGKNIAHILENELLTLPLSFWEVDLLKVALIITIVSIAICSMTIILNFTRHRRRTDKINRSLIICEVFSFVIGIFLIVKLFF